MKKNNCSNFVELFAGAGGLSEGFMELNNNPIAFIEKDTYCCETLKTRLSFHYLSKKNKLEDYYDYMRGSITRKQLLSKVPNKIFDKVLNFEINQKTTSRLIDKVKTSLKNQKLDILLGGPPCQAYSLMGRAQNKKKEKDERLYLYQYYLKFLKELKPTTFVFENVLGLLSIQKGKLFKNLINNFKELGYFVSYQILNASDYQVLQNRKRLVVIGNLNKEIQLEKLKKNKNKSVVSDLLSDLISIKPGEKNNQYLKKEINSYLKKSGIRTKHDVLTAHQARPHNKRDLDIYKTAISKWNNDKQRIKYNQLPKRLISHKNITSFLDRFKVVAGDVSASHTIVAHIAKDGHHYIHPDIAQCRSLSVREVARIQSFSDNYFFEGPRTAQFTQIGNAVPPLLSKFLAKQIML